MRQSNFWWLVVINGVHVRTYGTRTEAMADMDRHHKKNPSDKIEVNRGVRRTYSHGGGYFVVSPSTGN